MKVIDSLALPPTDVRLMPVTVYVVTGMPRFEVIVPALVLIRPAPVPEPPEAVPLGVLLATVMVTAAGSAAAAAMENKRMETGVFMSMSGIW